MPIYRSSIVLTVLALGMSQAAEYQEDGSTFPVPQPAAASAVPLYNPYECQRCWGVNSGEPKLLCGSDNKNYYNIEKLKCINQCKGTNVQIKYLGRCRHEDSQENSDSDSEFPKPPLPVIPTPGRHDCPCLKDTGKDVYAPFCGDDGYTYRSESEARCVTSCYGRYIIKQYDGPCNKSAKCNCRLTPISDPVCGSDGNTYMNREAMDCNNYCYRQRVRVMFKGKCDEVKTKTCELVCKNPED